MAPQTVLRYSRRSLSTTNSKNWRHKPFCDAWGWGLEKWSWESSRATSSVCGSVEWDSPERMASTEFAPCAHHARIGHMRGVRSQEVEIDPPHACMLARRRGAQCAGLTCAGLPSRGGARCALSSLHLLAQLSEPAFFLFELPAPRGQT